MNAGQQFLHISGNIFLVRPRRNDGRAAMVDAFQAFDEIAVEAGNRILRIGEVVLTPGQIKHIIVNNDTNETDDVAGSVVIETMPTYSNGWSVGPADGYQLQTDFSDTKIATDLTHFSVANGINHTTTSLDNERFHKTFWDVSAQQAESY
jgi:hypothetical protein